MNTETLKPTTFAMEENEPMKKVTCLLHEGVMYVPADAVEKLTEVSAALERANDELSMLYKKVKELADENELLRFGAHGKAEPFADPSPTFRQTFSGVWPGSHRMWTYAEIEKVVHAMLDKRLEKVFRTAWSDSPLFDGPYSSPDSQYLRNLTNEVIDSVDWAGASSELLGRTFVADQVRATKGDAQP